MPEKNSLSNIWVIGDEPVLVNWGMQDNVPGVIARPLELGQAPRPSASFDYLSLFLWLLFLAASLMLWARLLPACAVGNSSWGFCPAVEEPEDPEPENPDLTQLKVWLSQDRSQQQAIVALPQCDIDSPAYLDDGRLFNAENTPEEDDVILEEDTPEPEPEPEPEEGTPAPISRDDEVALNTALSQANAEFCDSEVLLQWDQPQVNLDLNILCPYSSDQGLGELPPEGRVVSTEFPRACGATYNIASPVEEQGTALDRICFDGDALPGAYTIGVLHVDGLSNQSDGIAYRVVVRQGAQTIAHQGVLAPDDAELVPIEIQME